MNKSIRIPRWSYWRACAEWKLYEAIALSLNLNPEALDGFYDEGKADTFSSSKAEEFEERIEIALTHLRAGTLFRLHPNMSKGSARQRAIAPTAFVEWAVGMKWKLPKQFLNLRQNPPPATSKGWPWGAYSTRKLCVLAATVEEFYADQSGDAPVAHTISGIAEWIRAHHGDVVTSDELARNIATIIRPDDAPRGRPPVKRGAQK